MVPRRALDPPVVAGTDDDLHPAVVVDVADRSARMKHLIGKPSPEFGDAGGFDVERPQHTAEVVDRPARGRVAADEDFEVTIGIDVEERR